VSFLYPLFLAGLAAVAVPILLHLFRRKTEVVVNFPAVRLLQKAPVEQQRRRRLRELILLVLRVTALVLLALAFARPYLPAADASVPVPVTVVALDTSLSMSAPNQSQRAREAARQAVQNAPATHSVALLTFADAAMLSVPPTTDRGAAMAAIDQVQPGAGGTRFRTALARAGEVISSGDGRIVVITDLQQAGWESSDEGAVPDGIEVQVVEVPAPAGNIAVTTLRREGTALVAGIHNFGLRRLRVPVRLRVDGKEIAAQPVELGPQAAADVRFTAQVPAHGGAEVRVDDPDGYAADNSRFEVLDPPAPAVILVVTAEPPASSNAGLYVERALSVAGDGQTFRPRVMDGRAFSALPPSELESAAGIVLLGTTTLDRAGREQIASFVKQGGRMLLTLGPDVDIGTLEDTIGAAISVEPDAIEASQRTVTLVATDNRHPIFRPFSDPGGALGDVYVERYRRLNSQSDRDVLARFTGAGDALVERSIGRGRLLVFASDLDNRWNRFPLNPAFVPWMIETARYLAQGRQPRQVFTLPNVPAGVPGEPGVHPTSNGPVAVNPDVRESNPARTSPDEFRAAISRSSAVRTTRVAAAAREQEERQRLWQVGLMVMFIALSCEGLLGRRAI
jgi:hypothetical protein